MEDRPRRRDTPTINAGSGYNPGFRRESLEQAKRRELRASKRGAPKKNGGFAMALAGAVCVIFACGVLYFSLAQSRQ
jgi:cytochrome c-type biogenesis protein CcmH/NrfG